LAGCLAVVALGVLVGGLVGYLTNKVAVWLLFHPVRPRCLPLVGLCLQGVVAARRRELARRMAGLVDRYLVSGRVWRRLEEEASRVVGEELRVAVRSSPFLAGLEPLLQGVVERVSGAVARAAAGVVRRVDIAGLVEEELARLDPGEVERLFWEMAGRELRFVVYSGLVLGGLVGLLQGLLLCLLGLGG